MKDYKKAIDEIEKWDESTLSEAQIEALEIALSALDRAMFADELFEDDLLEDSANEEN